MFLVIVLELGIQHATFFMFELDSLRASRTTAPNESISVIFPSTIEPVGIGFIE